MAVIWAGHKKPASACLVVIFFLEEKACFCVHNKEMGVVKTSRIRQVVIDSPAGKDG